MWRTCLIEKNRKNKVETGLFLKEIYYELVLETWFKIITQFNLDHSVVEVLTSIGARGERICKRNWTFDK